MNYVIIFFGVGLSLGDFGQSIITIGGLLIGCAGFFFNSFEVEKENKK